MKRFWLNIFIITICAGSLAFNYAQKQIEVGIDEKLGAYLPMDAEFVTSEGDTVTLKQVIDKPVLLALVYYECPGICSPLLNDLSWAMDRIKLEPGMDFKIVSLSFDTMENPTISSKWKKNYLNAMKRKISEDDWIFLTGDSLNIHKVTSAAGYYFKPSADSEYIHPASTIAIAPDGKISRYIFGTQFNQFDLKMALIDAKAGKTNPTIAKVLEFCYSYDPEGRDYKLNVTRIVGTVMLFSVAIFAVVLIFKKKKKNEGV